jgi:hypothetical protein
MDTREAVARRYCVNGAELRLPTAPRPSWFTGVLDETIRSYAREHRFLQMPSFYGTNAIGVFSDYGGSHGESRFDTYTFLFADYGALGTFDERVKAVRDRFHLPRTREIAFKALREGAIAAAVPEVLHAADNLPGLLFTLAVEKSVQSVLAPDPKVVRDQLRQAGFQSWDAPKDAERVFRVFHSVVYWLSLLGRPGMKTLWMTDRDNIHGRSDFADEFSKLYVNMFPQFEAPEFSIVGIAKSFEVDEEQPVLHEAVSISDLVAGAMSAYLTEKRGGVVPGERRHPIIGDILTFLGHQSPFLKKLTFVVQQQPSGEPGYGEATVVSTKRSTDGYLGVEFDENGSPTIAQL